MEPSCQGRTVLTFEVVRDADHYNPLFEEECTFEHE